MANLKKLMIACVVISSPAWAGEVNGKGDPTPVQGRIASSICSFSGLDDDGSGIQSYGQIVRALGVPNPFPSPGAACNGNTGYFSG